MLLFLLHSRLFYAYASLRLFRVFPPSKPEGVKVTFKLGTISRRTSHNFFCHRFVMSLFSPELILPPCVILDSFTTAMLKHAHKLTLTCTHAHTHAHLQTHTHTHTHTHMLTYTRTPICFAPVIKKCMINNYDNKKNVKCKCDHGGSTL